MYKFKWVFKWKKDVDGDTYFVPVWLPEESRYLAIWRSESGALVVAREPKKEIAQLKAVKPTAKDFRMAIEYTFSVNDFFKGL